MGWCRSDERRWERLGVLFTCSRRAAQRNLYKQVVAGLVPEFSLRIRTAEQVASLSNGACRTERAADGQSGLVNAANGSAIATRINTIPRFLLPSKGEKISVTQL
jgi:hypothetical protein